MRLGIWLGLVAVTVIGCGTRTSPIYEGADSTVLRGAQHAPQASACVCMCSSPSQKTDPIPPLLAPPKVVPPCLPERKEP